MEVIAAFPAKRNNYIALDNRNNPVWMVAGAVHVLDVLTIATAALPYPIALLHQSHVV